MSINLTDEIEVKTKKGKLGAAKQIFIEGDTQTVEKEIQDINSRHNDLSSKHESLSSTVSEHAKQIESNQSQITANKSAQDEKNTSLDANMAKLNTRDDQITELVKGVTATGGASVATAVTYDNTSSNLDAATVQGALDELVTKKISKEDIAQELGDSKEKVISQFALPFREVESPEFIKVIVDANDHLLFTINLNGEVDWGKGIPAPIKAKLQEIINQFQQDNNTLKGILDKATIKDEEGIVVETPFRYIQNEEFIFAKVDAEDKLLFGIQWDGTPKFGKTSEVEDELQKQITILAERVAVIIGDDDITSTIDTLNELKTFFANIDNTQSLTDILANLENVAKSLDKTTIKDEEGNVQDTPFRVIENEEFIKAIVDSDDKVLFGFYRETGESYYPLNEMYHVIQNEEYFAAWVTTDDKVVLGLRRDGQIIGEIHAVNALKQVISQLQSDLASLQEKVGTIDSNLKELLDIFSLQENPEYMAVEKDADGKILGYTAPDGSHYLYKVKSETIDNKVDKEKGKSLINADVANTYTILNDPEGRTEITVDNAGNICGYRDSEGKRHEHSLQVEQFYEKGRKVSYVTKDYVNAKSDELSEKNLSELNGVVDYSLKNLFDKSKIRTYDSDFAKKVFAAIGRKTAETGCYSNNIPCKVGDWFTRNDFGTGIVVVLDKDDNIIGDVKNVAYKPTFQIRASEGQDFTNATSVVMVVMLSSLNTQRIVKAKYVPSKEEDAIRIPKLKIGQENIDLGITTYVKGSSGRYYSIGVDDNSDTPKISLTKLEGIPASELPSDFPKFYLSGSFSDYYDSILLCPISGGEPYMFEIGNNGLVRRYRKVTANCPKTMIENEIRYYYGVNGSLNTSSGKLAIYKANGESYDIVNSNITDTEGNLIEPHDCCLISVNPLHVITQRYIENQTTIVDGYARTVTSLVLEEQYDGKKVWEWNSVDYPELWIDSHHRGYNDDYLHNNTISLDNDGNLLINNKQANQMLVIERTWDNNSHTGSIGNILWKIGGNRGAGFNYDVSNRIKTTEEQQWYESHDAIVDENGVYTMFDNRSSYPSRIIEFKIDTIEKKVVNFKEYTYKSNGGRYMGSVAKCKDGVFLVSWGSLRSTESPNIGIYDFRNNKPIFELSFDNKAYNVYRVYGIKNK